VRRFVVSDAIRGLRKLPSALDQLQRRTLAGLSEADPPTRASSRPEPTEHPAVVGQRATFAPLEVGWHPDPYRRWKARYWNGQCWTEQVANPGDGEHPVLGTDVIVPSGDASAAVASIVLLESFINGELVRLRSEAEKWRAIAEERGLALARMENAVAPRQGAPRADRNTSSWYAQIYDQ
jgi:hypothetical protein